MKDKEKQELIKIEASARDHAMAINNLIHKAAAIDPKSALKIEAGIMQYLNAKD